MDSQKQQELTELINLLLDDHLSDSQRDRLSELLRDDREAQQLYAEYCQAHAMLAWEHGVLPEVDFDPMLSERLPTEQSTSRLQALRWWQRFALAASVLCMLTLGSSIYLALRQQAPVAQVEPSTPDVPEAIQPPRVPWSERTIFATFVTGRGARLFAEDLPTNLRQGDSLRSGHYRLSDGFAEVKFRNNVEVLIESPADFEIVSDMKMIMHRGRLSASVSPEGIGFSVETPSIDLTDFGTEFAVDVLPNQTSEVHVFSGEVKVAPKLAPVDQERVQLNANQATRVLGTSGIPEGIDIAMDRFFRHLNETPEGDEAYQQLITNLDPVSLYRMAPSVDGVILADQGPNHSDGILLADHMINPPFKPGRIGSSLYLEGPYAGAYAKVPRYVPVEKGAITVCAWVKANSRPRWAAIAKHWSIEFDENNSPYGIGGQFHFGLHDYTGDLEVQVRDKDANVIKLREYQPLPLGQWQHVAFVADGQNVRLYRNAVEVASARCDGLATNGPPSMAIGAKLSHDCSQPDDRNPGYWHGRIDELAIFDRALTPDELSQLFENVPAVAPTK
ncbi:LamG-like jellyroll fold domain-containing protein [Bremerella cremea]|uniref:LamG-like jellyroll fold domain-containing protein n=1 Tax=Bremerella cremea TaxID=1031537 RepID=UPI0031F09DA5